MGVATDTADRAELKTYTYCNMTTKLSKIEEDYQNLLCEIPILKCKLKSKAEAILILSAELEQSRNERDQYRLMSDQLRDRYNSLKRRVEGWGPSLLGVYDIKSCRGEEQCQSLVQLLCELKEHNKSLQHEAADMKQKLSDAQGDIKVLREQIAKHKAETSDDSVVVNQLPLQEREDLVQQLEYLRQKCILLERDLQAVLDEKEELITARDAYHHKVDRLNHQLNLMLRSDEQRIVDIDAVLMENRYLHERLKQMEEEMSMLTSTLTKYKCMLEKKHTRGGLRFGNTVGGMAITNKQVQQLLHSSSVLQLPNNPATVADLRSLVVALFEVLNDKTLALSHQKKANKILGNRVTELEKKIRALELSSLFKGHVSAKACLEITEQWEDGAQNNSDTWEVGIPPGVETDKRESRCDDEDNPSCDTPSCSHYSRSGSGVSSLDLVPMKEVQSFDVEKCIPSHTVSSSGSNFSISHSSSPLHTPLSSSPVHFGTSLVNDSDRMLHRRFSSPLNTGAKRVTRFRSQSEMEDEDLPPELQKLLMAAMDELEKHSSQDELGNSQEASPTHRTETFNLPDPSC